jgi:hypothetical protein
LLAILRDSRQDLAVREEAVRALLRTRENDRRKLYEALTAMGEEAHFAAPVFADFIADKDHWNDPSLGAVRLLETWGPNAAVAVPALTEALRNPNQWDYAPAAAKALAAIGPEARSAIPALREAAQSEHEALREAAQDAITRIEAAADAATDVNNK